MGPIEKLQAQKAAFRPQRVYCAENLSFPKSVRKRAAREALFPNLTLRQTEFADDCVPKRSSGTKSNDENGAREQEEVMQCRRLHVE